MAHDHDIFLSHASEDKETFVQELHHKLTNAKYKVWYDETNLSWGDNLKREIEEGLRASKYGIVVISNNYFAKDKEWTRREFNKILTNNNILPILLGITMEEIKKKHPQEYEEIKNWLAINSNKGIDYIVRETKKKIDNLKSESNIDYIKLRDLLAAKNWKDADHETYLVMLKVVGREGDDWIRDEELLNFPCTDLRTIDSLWVKYSNGRFGFSVQKKIYLEVGGVPDGKFDYKAWQKFGGRVGWSENLLRKFFNEENDNLFFDTTPLDLDTTAPVGQLPCRYGGPLRVVVSSLASRLANCNL